MQLSEEKTMVMSGSMLKSPPFKTEFSRILFFRRPKAIRPRWRYRYFVLYRITGSASSHGAGGSDHCLLYYKDRNQLTKPKVAIDLSNATNIVTDIIPPPSVLADMPTKTIRNQAGHLPIFQLDTKHKSQSRTYFFLPESPARMELWVRCISYACGFCEDNGLEDDDNAAVQPAPPPTSEDPPSDTYNLLPGEASRPGQDNADDDSSEDVYRVPPTLGNGEHPVYGVPPGSAVGEADDPYGLPDIRQQAPKPPPRGATRQPARAEDGGNAAAGVPPQPAGQTAPGLPQYVNLAPKQRHPPSSSRDEALEAGGTPGCGEGEPVRRTAISRVFTLRRTAASRPTPPPPMPMSSSPPLPLPLPRRRRPDGDTGAPSTASSSDEDSSDESGSVESAAELPAF